MTAATYRRSGSPKRSWKSSIISAPPATKRKKSRGTGVVGGVMYRDNLVKIVVDVPDSAANRKWMKSFKASWKTRLEQLELWMVSYRIEVD